MNKGPFLLALVVACNGTEPIEPEPQLAAGTYSLVAVNGNDLPFATSSGMLESSVVVVNADQTFAETSVTGGSNSFGAIIGHAVGKVVFRSDGFRFWANSDSTQTMFTQGNLEGSNLTVDFYGQTRVFQKQP